MAISASYVGEMGAGCCSRTSCSNPNPLFVSNSPIHLTTNASRSDYQALQVRASAAVSHGLSACRSDAWSHSTDDVSTEQAGGYRPDPYVDHGSSDFDVRHAFNAAFTCEIPARHWTPMAGAILNNWSIDAIFSAKTALPVNVFFDRGDTGAAEASLLARPDSVAGVVLYLHDSKLPGGRRINPEAFSVPFQARQGSLQRNAFRGFSTSQLDFDVRRNFSITEQMKLQLRADFFNIFNRPNFVSVDGYLGFFEPPLDANSNFGLAGPPAGNPRSIQLSLRLHF